MANPLSQFSIGATFREILLQLLKIQPGFFHEKASIEKEISRMKRQRMQPKKPQRKEEGC